MTDTVTIRRELLAPFVKLAQQIVDLNWFPDGCPIGAAPHKEDRTITIGDLRKLVASTFSSPPPPSGLLREALAAQFTKILSPAIDARAPYAKQMIAALVDAAIAPSSPPPSGLREALEAVDTHWTSVFPFGPDEPDAPKRITSAALNTWRIVKRALASPDDGWVKVDEEHPLPALLSGDELIVRVKDSGLTSAIIYDHVAYRRRPSAEQGE